MTYKIQYYKARCSINTLPYNIIIVFHTNLTCQLIHLYERAHSVQTWIIWILTYNIHYLYYPWFKAIKFTVNHVQERKILKGDVGMVYTNKEGQ